MGNIFQKLIQKAGFNPVEQIAKTVQDGIKDGKSVFQIMGGDAPKTPPVVPTSGPAVSNGAQAAAAPSSPPVGPVGIALGNATQDQIDQFKKNWIRI